MHNMLSDNLTWY